MLSGVMVMSVRLRAGRLMAVAVVVLMAAPVAPATAGTDGGARVVQTTGGTFAASPAVGWPALSVEVLAGADRFATAVAVSRAGWPAGAPAAVLASGTDYPDALAATALAGTVGGPVLLTGRDRLDARTAEELQRLAPATVYVVGGGQAVSAEVVAAVQGLGPAVERVAGENRYETAFAVATRTIGLGGDPSRVLLASGEGFADALSASSLAAGLRHPVVLVSATTDPAVLAERLALLGAAQVWVVGGPAALPDAPLRGLAGFERLAGRDRTETAVVVARRARELGLGGPPAVASAATFPDGLTGGTLAGAVRRAPVLLTSRDQLPVALMDWLAADRPVAVTQLGGAAAIGPVATCQLRAGQARPWRCVEEELARQGYNVGAADGVVDHQSPWAVYALQKVAGLPVTGRFAEPEWRAMLQRPTLPPRRPDLPANHVEIDLARQLLMIYRGGRMAHAFHVSTGKPSTPTVRGSFTIYRKLSYRNASDMYKPMYFYNRYAIHGYPQVPLYPASHGCVRTYDGDQDFLWPKVPIGERVAVY
jgi:putative cell wall-binding protein/lipoprotein-anchoring transpeptidase ErfK/SrfK